MELKLSDSLKEFIKAATTVELAMKSDLKLLAQRELNGLTLKYIDVIDDDDQDYYAEVHVHESVDPYDPRVFNAEQVLLRYLEQNHSYAIKVVVGHNITFNY